MSWEHTMKTILLRLHCFVKIWIIFLMHWTWEIRQVTESVKIFLNLMGIFMIQRLIGFKMYFGISVKLEKKYWGPTGPIYFKCKRPHVYLMVNIWWHTNFSALTYWSCKMFATQGMEFVLTEHLNQDCVEEYFRR